MNDSLPGMADQQEQDASSNGNGRTNNTLTYEQADDLRDWLVSNADRLARDRPSDTDVANQAAADPAITFPVTRHNIKKMRTVCARKHRKLAYDPGGPANLDTNIEVLRSLAKAVNAFAAELVLDGSQHAPMHHAASELRERSADVLTRLDEDT